MGSPSRRNQPCPAGRYGATPGLPSALCSGPCVQGYYCPAASTHPQVTTPLPPRLPPPIPSILSSTPPSTLSPTLPPTFSPASSPNLSPASSPTFSPNLYLLFLSIFLPDPLFNTPYEYSILLPSYFLPSFLPPSILLLSSNKPAVVLRCIALRDLQRHCRCPRGIIP